MTDYRVTWATNYSTRKLKRTYRKVLKRLWKWHARFAKLDKYQTGFTTARDYYLWYHKRWDQAKDELKHRGFYA